MGQEHGSASGFARLIDLASARMGGRAIACSDDFFAEKENLVKPGRAVFIADKYTERGKWMDGWESRRKRTPGHDWCIVQLGQAGRIRGVNVDTSHFNGNQPEWCTLEGTELPPESGAKDALDDRVRWTLVVDRAPLKPTSEHLIEARGEVADRRFTHVRLNIHPDGGVARLRVHGEVAADWETLRRFKGPLEVSAAKYGGLVVACNDMHFGSGHNMLMPDEPPNMGDGWETRRKRGLTWKDGRPEEYDWAVVRLAHRSTISGAMVSTKFFKGNFPESCAIEVCDSNEGAPDAERGAWTPLLTRSMLRADTEHDFGDSLEKGALDRPWTHARVRIFPDGGIARLRLWGRPVLEGRGS